MTCSACGAKSTIKDDTCTTCGADQNPYRLPAKRVPAQPPALWRQAAPVVARGAALVVAGFVGEWLLRTAAKKAVQAPFSRSSSEDRAVAKRDPERSGATIAVSETIVMRRVIVRR